MTGREALMACVFDGAKIRLKHWSEGKFLYYCKDTSTIRFGGNDELADLSWFTAVSSNARWQVYEEPWSLPQVIAQLRDDPCKKAVMIGNDEFKKSICQHDWVIFMGDDSSLLWTSCFTSSHLAHGTLPVTKEVLEAKYRIYK